MSYDDGFFKSFRRVRHKYEHRRRSKTSTCALCGCQRRRDASGWLYRPPKTWDVHRSWTTLNPPCVLKDGTRGE